ncbi:MAG: hypothetical protein EBZ46_07345 [Actinobacteria bacterium]|nr:hypothetical protein [Actinomycetota bacterium]
MSVSAARQRRAIRVALAATVVAVAALPVGGVLAWNQLLDSRASTTVAVESLSIPETPAALVAALGAGGQLSHVWVATLDASGVGGTVVLLPIGAATEQAPVDAASTDGSATTSTPAERLAEVYARDGMGGLANEVQGLLDVSFVSVGALTRTELINVFAPLGGVDVLLDRPVVSVAVDGTPTQLAGPGEQSFAIDRVVDILIARRPNEKESERFARHREVWNGVVKRVGAGVELAPAVDTTPAGLADASNFMRRVLGGAMQVWQLSAAPVLDKTLNPKRIDMYSLDRAEVVMVFASVAPSALSGADLPVSVMIDSPFNDPIVSRAAVQRLLDAGIGVAVMREVSAREESATTVAGDDDVTSAINEALGDSFGTLQTTSWDAPVSGVAARITLGSQFAALARDDSQ